MAREKSRPEGAEDGAGDPWSGLKKGDYLGLRDLEAFSAGGMGGVDYRVLSTSLIRLRDRDSGRELARYRLADLESPDGRDCRFAVLSAGEDRELRFYHAPAVFARGSRDELVDLGQTWFFLPPVDPEDFISSDLEYAPWPDLPPFDEGCGEERKRVYGPHGFGRAVYGDCEREGERFPVQIVEYRTEEEARNPLLLLLEERWMRPGGEVPPEGGYVTVLAGRVLAETEVEHIPA